jgi:hypothetical protein
LKDVLSSLTFTWNMEGFDSGERDRGSGGAAEEVAVLLLELTLRAYVFGECK